jgi:hypothetical protein
MSHYQPVSPRKSLNKAYLKVKPNRIQIEAFKLNLIQLLDHINDSEGEEFHKNVLSDFLKNTWYSDRFFINTKGREDLAIYNGKDAKSPAGVIIEAKSPTNKYEMISKENINSKAFHELILYYLRERVTGNNLEIKQLIATNIYEWFIFDASLFEKMFANNKSLVRQFTEFEAKRMSGTNTDFFYKEIAAPFVENLKEEISFTHFDLRSIEKPLRDNRKDNDSILIPYYKIFSPEHLLKLPFSNDSNSLDRSFYNELLHIIGLEETKEGSKKVIGRKAEGKRDTGSLLENTITILGYEDCLNNVKRSEFGSVKEEQLYNIALELVITWINRILFLKLLEGQLVQYHNGDKSFRFLNNTLIPDFDALNKLFFQVLAIREEDRNELVKKKFSKIPYLNSSLFEPSELEQKTIRISNLEDEYTLPVLTNTVLKDTAGKRIKGVRNALNYLFEFLDSYDFASEGSEEIQEENKTLINASVLGLIFEKINGYKDGSFFTPGFITMYMCRETIRRAVVQKFNDGWKWNCNDFDELKEDLFAEIKTGSKGREQARKEANELINSLHICDPAVGSGHFLVSALNEIIAIKSELRILTDREGKPLTDYAIEIANDELIITNLDDELFEYRPSNHESQRVQETLFHEKQTIIENCLFGVDINPNSVKICRLRLWIELLKNAYYRTDAMHGVSTNQLETLPNIDINIKCGNSLISRYALDADIKQALKRSKWTIDSYRIAVMAYRNARSKEEKHGLEKLIDQIKNDFESEVAANDKRLLKVNRLRGELYAHTNQQGLFEKSKAEQKAFDEKAKKLASEITKIENELAEIKNNAIYDNAFEWRFEFPEVLNDEGDFVGFDVVIGNPPYLRSREIMNEEEKSFYYEKYKTISYQPDLYKLFIELATIISKDKTKICLITPSVFLSNDYDKNLRMHLLANFSMSFVCVPNDEVFDEANVSITVFLIEKKTDNTNIQILKISNKEFSPKGKIQQNLFEKENYVINTTIDNCEFDLVNKIAQSSQNLAQHFDVKNGIKVRKELLFNEKLSDDFKPFSLGKDISSLGVLKMSCYIHYTKENEYKFTNQAFRTPEIFKKEKLVIRQIPAKNRIIGTYDDKGIYTDQTIYNIQSISENDFNLKDLLAILTSKLMFFYFKNTSFDNKDLFPKIKRSQLLELPIRAFNNDLMSKLIDQILFAKSQNPASDTTALEAEIDLMVYKLYNLTWEEVKIVDPEFAMSAEEYEKN